ncbi:unnamed protein product [Mytilus coruscus]|uniref:Uncharacterized protein n=1 Tax=Mytilus coruscus TaxID=42192 RepID=A0A6J8F4C6_MYTCO|nr:unnamed protein product [Mytilus coruscus]
MGLSDNEARIHIELRKDPKTIEETLQQVITYRETTSETQEDQTVEKKQNTNFNKQGSTNTETDVISVTKDELQKMFDKMYEDKKRNDETQTSITGHYHHDERQFDRQPFNANTPSYVPNGNYRKNHSDRNTNPENIPKCYYCGQPERVNPADQELALKFNENGHKLENIGVHEPTSSITLFSNNKSEENISNSNEENISNSKNISNSGNKSNKENISDSNSNEENISNSNSENISNSNRENVSNSNSENKVKDGDNSNISR